MKLITLANSKNALQKLVTCDLPVSFSWDLTLFIEKANPEFKSYDIRMNDLVAKYGEPIPDTRNKYHVTPEMPGWYEFCLKREELNNIEIEIEHPTITIEELKKIPGLNLSPANLTALSYIIK